MELQAYRFRITQHARERYVQRFSKERDQFTHLSNCNGCETCDEVWFELDSLVRRNKNMWDKIICAKVHDAKDVKIFHNNQNFMEQMYKKYGYDRYRFMVESNIIFVICENEIGNVLRTCMDVNWPINGSFVIANYINRPKYGKKVI